LPGSVASSQGKDHQAEGFYLRAKAIFEHQPDDLEGESKAMLLANLAKLRSGASRRQSIEKINNAAR
jgi:hypothetical protein